MTRRILPIVIGLLILFALGVVDAAMDLIGLARRQRFTHAYQKRWIGFVRDYENNRGNSEDYIWLTRNQGAMSSELGAEGVIAYRAPYGAFTSNRYWLLPNTLLQVREGRAHHADLDHVDHLLIAHEGALAHSRRRARADLTNPFALLRRGLQFSVSLPLLVLAWMGFVSEASVQRTRHNVFFRILQLIAGLVVLFSAFETAVVGWPTFATQVREWTGLPLH